MQFYVMLAVIGWGWAIVFFAALLIRKTVTPALPREYTGEGEKS